MKLVSHMNTGARNNTLLSLLSDYPLPSRMDYGQPLDSLPVLTLGHADTHKELVDSGHAENLTKSFNPARRKEAQRALHGSSRLQDQANS